MGENSAHDLPTWRSARPAVDSYGGNGPPASCLLRRSHRRRLAHQAVPHPGGREAGPLYMAASRRRVLPNPDAPSMTPSKADEQRLPAAVLVRWPTEFLG